MLSDVGYDISGCNIENIEIDNIKACLMSEDFSFKLNDSVISTSMKYPFLLREAL